MSSTPAESFSACRAAANIPVAYFSFLTYRCGTWRGLGIRDGREGDVNMSSFFLLVIHILHHENSTKHSRALLYTPGFFRSVLLIYFTVNLYATFWPATGTR